MTFDVILGRPPVSKMKLLEKCNWRCSVIFIASLIFIAALDMSVMDEMMLQWVSYFCQNNIKHKVSVNIDGGNEDWGCFKNIKIPLCQVNLTNYDYDKCRRKNRSGSFPWIVVALQNYPKKELLQMIWVCCKTTFMQVWLFWKVTTQWSGSLGKTYLLFKLLRGFSKVRERGESYSLIS